MIKDRVVVTKPTRVQVEVDRNDNTFKRASIVDEIVAEWWADEGAEIVLEPWIEQGVRHEGWKVTRHEGSHVVPEVDGGIGSPNWRKVSEEIADLLKSGNIREALDRHEIAAMQQAMVDEPEAHEHTFDSETGQTPSDDAVCQFEGCRRTYGETA